MNYPSKYTVRTPGRNGRPRHALVALCWMSLLWLACGCQQDTKPTVANSSVPTVDFAALAYPAETTALLKVPALSFLPADVSPLVVAPQPATLLSVVDIAGQVAKDVGPFDKLAKALSSSSAGLRLDTVAEATAAGIDLQSPWGRGVARR